MQKAFFTVILVGTLIGAMMPSGRKAGAPAPAPAKAERLAPGEMRETVIERSPMGHFYVDADVNDGLVHFVVDTGATSVALTVDDARRLNIPFSESDFYPVARGAGGNVNGMEITLDRVSLDGKEARQVPAVILSGLDVSLLGQAYLTRMGGVEMTGDTMRIR